jgi:hypothetical protein
MENATLRASTFVGFNFGAAPATAFVNENALFNPLLDRTLGVTQLAHQPDKNAARQELVDLVHGAGDPARPGLLNLTGPGITNDGERTQDIAKAVCAVVVGGAAMLVQ